MQVLPLMMAIGRSSSLPVLLTKQTKRMKGNLPVQGPGSPRFRHLQPLAEHGDYGRSLLTGATAGRQETVLENTRCHGDASRAEKTASLV